MPETPAPREPNADPRLLSQSDIDRAFSFISGRMPAGTLDEWHEICGLRNHIAALTEQLAARPSEQAVRELVEAGNAITEPFDPRSTVEAYKKKQERFRAALAALAPSPNKETTT